MYARTLQLHPCSILAAAEGRCTECMHGCQTPLSNLSETCHFKSRSCIPYCRIELRARVLPQQLVYFLPSVHSLSPVFGRDSLHSFHLRLPIRLQPLVAVDPRHGRAMHLLENGVWKGASEPQCDMLDAVPGVPSRGGQFYWLRAMASRNLVDAAVRGNMCTRQVGWQAISYSSSAAVFTLCYEVCTGACSQTTYLRFLLLASTRNLPPRGPGPLWHQRRRAPSSPLPGGSGRADVSRLLPSGWAGIHCT